jgi:hypothetical protein
MPKPVSEVLDGEAEALLSKWARENADKVWLGAKSRDKVREDVKAALRAAYEMGKRIGAKSRGPS